MQKKPESHWHSFRVMLPRKLTECSDETLRFCYLTLKNASSAITVQMLRIKRELDRRGTSTSILEAVRRDIADEEGSSISRKIREN